MSQPLPTAQPLRWFPTQSVHDKYEASKIPRTLRASSGQFGPALSGYRMAVTERLGVVLFFLLWLLYP